LKHYVFALLASSAFGQGFYSYYGYGYYTNAGVSGVPDSQLSIVNPGSAGVGLCANVYVLDAQNDFRECCSCKVSPNGIATFSLNTNLTANPLRTFTQPVNGFNLSVPSGVIAVVSSLPTITVIFPEVKTSCQGGNYTPAGQLGGSITHVHQPETGALSVSEAPLLVTSNGLSELSRLQSLCSLVNNSTFGSAPGSGTCSCPVE
jgi:hypothetical protein